MEVNGSWCDLENMSRLYLVLDLSLEDVRELIFADEESSRKVFKQWALSLHPDKNSHPLAKEAFQKLQLASTQS